MNKIVVYVAILLGAVALQSHLTPARAGGVWISATGDDGNLGVACSATAPCQTFHTAMLAIGSGGQVSCLGPVLDQEMSATSITISVNIDCPGVSGGFEQEGNNTNGLVINAPGDQITLRGLHLSGTNAPGTGGPRGATAILIQAAATVDIEDCVIENWSQNGVSVTTSANTVVNIKNTSIKNSGNGISFTPMAGGVNGIIDHTKIAKVSGNGITTNGGSVFFTVTSSVITNAAGVAVNSGGAGTVIGVSSSSISNNHTAFATSGGILRISRNVIYDNTVNYSVAGGTIATSGDNDVAVNGSTTPNGTVTRQ